MKARFSEKFELFELLSFYGNTKNFCEMEDAKEIEKNMKANVQY